MLALFTAPALAQPPGTRPSAAPPGTQPQPGAQPQPNGLALPPGYRPRTPPPAAQEQPQLQRPAPGARPGTGGTVMYFQKPADALTATGGGLPAAGDGVAQLGAPAVTPQAAPDVPPKRPLPVPPDRSSWSRPAPAEPAIPLNNPPAAPPSRAVPVGYAAQPVVQPQPGDMKSTSQRQDPPKAVPLEAIQLPAREKIFGMVFNDRELEQAIVESIRADLKKDKVEATDVSIRFPPLPVISPPGVPYQPKTVAYEPRTLRIEPNYLVHRRLHFEDKNTERAGWDLGPLQTLASAGHFYGHVLFWPQSLASGGVFGRWDTSAGKCLPGGPTPYYLYPPNLTLRGIAAEAGIITGAAFLLQ